MVGRLLSAMRDEVPASLGGRGVLIASCRNPGFNSLASVPRALMAEAYEASVKAFIDQVDECAAWAHVVPGADKPWQGVMSDRRPKKTEGYLYVQVNNADVLATGHLHGAVVPVMSLPNGRRSPCHVERRGMRGTAGPIPLDSELS